MSVGGSGPIAKPLFIPRVTPHYVSMSSQSLSAVAMYIYTVLGDGVSSEVYLHGPTILRHLVYYGQFTEEDRGLFTRAIVELDERGCVQQRGPYTWALSLGATISGFTTQPRSVPPREWILKRHYWRCRYCTADLKKVGAHIDHVYPKSRGGWDDAANLVAACPTCNASKGDQIVWDWLEIHKHTIRCFYHFGDLKDADAYDRAEELGEEDLF